MANLIQAITITILCMAIDKAMCIKEDGLLSLRTEPDANKSRVIHAADTRQIRNNGISSPHIITQNCPWSCNCLTPMLVICTGDRWDRIPKLPQKTKSIVINNGHLEKLHDQSFQKINAEGLNSLDLRNNSIKDISSNGLDCLNNVLTIDLSGNLLDTIQPILFNKTKRVTSLNLSNNKLIEFPWRALCSLPNLTNLDIGYNSHMAVYFDKCFTHLTSLKNVKLNGTQMSGINKYTFIGLQKSPITSIYLRHSNISHLSWNVFTYVTQITHLDLAFNLLHNLDKQTFQLLRSLQYINLHGNKFRVFDFNILLPAVSLKRIIIGNENFSFDDVSFKPLADIAKLEYLKLDTGQLSHIRLSNFSSFENHTCLQEIHIVNCHVHKIERGSFKHFHHLTKLVIRSTSYFSTHIRQVLDNLDSELSYFSLRYNYRMRLTSHSFTSLVHPESLAVVDLSNNHLTGFIPLKALEALPNLKKLVLKNNYITDVEIGSLPILKRVQFVDLSSNAIKLIRQEMLCSFPNVEYLDLSYNIIATLMYDQDMKCVENIKHLLLRDNKITTIRYFNVFKNLDKLSLGSNELHTLHGNEFLGLYNLRYLYLDDNSLWKLPLNSFNDLINLKFLSLNHNYIYSILPATFEPLTNLETLSIMNNHLDLLNVSAINKLTSLKELRLARNDLICNCHFRSVYQYVKRHGIFMPLLSTTLETVCLTTKGEVLNVIDFNLTERECQPIIQVDVISSVFLAACITMFLISVVYRFRWYIRYKQYLLRSKLSGYRETVSNRTYQHDAFVSFCERDCEWVMDTLVEHVENNQDIRYGIWSNM